MKTLLFVTALCLVPLQSLAAEDISINGQTYRLETIQPVSMDSLGRIVPMPPMTVLVPVKTVQIKRQPAPRTTRTFSSQVAQSPRSQSMTQSRLARTSKLTPDVARPIFDQRPTKVRDTRSTTKTADRNQNHLASTSQKDRTSMLLDSRISQRRVF